MPAEKRESAGRPVVENPQLGLFAHEAVSGLENPRKALRWSK
jgi:hypothetical protein